MKKDLVARVFVSGVAVLALVGPEASAHHDDEHPDAASFARVRVEAGDRVGGGCESSAFDPAYVTINHFRGDDGTEEIDHWAGRSGPHEAGVRFGPQRIETAAFEMTPGYSGGNLVMVAPGPGEIVSASAQWGPETVCWTLLQRAGAAKIESVGRSLDLARVSGWDGRRLQGGASVYAWWAVSAQAHVDVDVRGEALALLQGIGRARVVDPSGDIHESPSAGCALRLSFCVLDPVLVSEREPGRWRFEVDASPSTAAWLFDLPLEDPAPED